MRVCIPRDFLLNQIGWETITLHARTLWFTRITKKRERENRKKKKNVRTPNGRMNWTHNPSPCARKSMAGKQRPPCCIVNQLPHTSERASDRYTNPIQCSPISSNYKCSNAFARALIFRTKIISVAAQRTHSDIAINSRISNTLCVGCKWSKLFLINFCEKPAFADDDSY